jgi:tetratricopeptide (TPR) repeat protein
MDDRRSLSLQRIARFAALLGASLAAACSGSPPPAAAATAERPAPPPKPAAPFHRTITTKSREAQRLFDRGLLLGYGFNHEAAVTAFEQAAAADPACAMAHWGKAFALGPNINNPRMDEKATHAAVESVGKAQALAAGAAPVERELIEALSHRYELPPPADRKLLDAVYADAMRKVWHDFPKDPDVGALFGESLLDLRPWDQWRPDGLPQPGTLEAVAAIEAVLAFAPDHPGANHMAIHALEASPHPERALPAADRLRTLVPDSGHLLHMPAHIDMMLGHYGEAVAANQRGIAADDRELDLPQNSGIYANYRAHNHRHLAWAAMYDGQKSVALAAARTVVERLSAMEPMRPPASIEASLALPWHVLVRFGDWEAILAEPAPAPGQKALRAFWLEARTLALSGLRRLDDADASREEFETAIAEVPADFRLGKNSVKDLLEIARAFTAGELDYRHGRYEPAFAQLRDAVAKEDALHYDEPADWMQPVRHALGALLLEQGRVAEAEATYHEDLQRHPENGWSLHGLAECLRRTGRNAEAESVEERFRAAWKRADVVLPGSCFCRIGVAAAGG